MMHAANGAHHNIL